jgi:hypothetical protein
VVLLNEISLRTGAIAGFLAKIKQYANQLDNEVRQLKSNTNAIQCSKTSEETKTNLANELNNIGNLFYLQRKMVIHTGLTFASTCVGVDKGAEIL